MWGRMPQGKRVLLVEDDEVIRELIVDDLVERGYVVDEVTDGAQALDAVSRLRPDVIVLDLMLPFVHGWAFMESYQERTDGELIPIVVVSAAGALPGSFDRFGVRRFLAKPFNLDDLATEIATATGPQPLPRAC